MIRLLLILVAAVILPEMVDMSSHTQKQCIPGYSDANPVRSFVGIQLGETHVLADSTTAAQALKGCFSLNVFVEKMIDHFAGYGVDLSAMRRRPLEPYEDDKVTVKIFSLKPGTILRTLISTFYEYANYIDIHSEIFTASLETKTEVQGRRGNIPSNGQGSYGIFNFMDHGAAHCSIWHRLSEPTGALKGNVSVPLVFPAENDVWGPGEFTGLTRIINGLVHDCIFVITYFGSNK